MAAARLPPLPFLIVGTLASTILVRIDAARLDGFAKDTGSVDASEGAVTTVSGISSARAKPSKSDDRAARDLELRRTAHFIDSVDFKDPMSLSDIRDILHRFDELRREVLSIGAFRDTRSRDEVRRLLRDIRKKTDVMNKLAVLKETRGEVDDGGDVPPSQRVNICSNIGKFAVSSRFREDLRKLCEALDAIRDLVKTDRGEEEQLVLSEVSRRLINLKVAEEYSLPHISWGISSVLGEEMRWRRKRLSASEGEKGDSAPKPMASVQAFPGPWTTDVSSYSHMDPVQRENGLVEAEDYAKEVNVEEHISLNELRAIILRLELYKEMVADYILLSEPLFRERIRGVLRLIKEKSDAASALVARREAAGEVDESESQPPSQRNKLCKELDEFGFAPDLRDELKAICDAMDQVRESTLAGEDGDAALMKVFGLMKFVRSRPGYVDTWVASELELMLAEEWRWVSSRG